MLQELFFSISGPTSGNTSLGSISLNDATNGSGIFSLKQTGAARAGTAVVQTRNGQGGFILCAQAEKGLLNVYSFQKDQMMFRMVLPEKLCSIAVDHKGEYCAGGTINGRVYLWEVASGILYNSWEAHYRKINVIKFSQDGAGIITGSDDSAVHVWELSRLLDESLQNEIPSPFCSFSDHTLPVTDIIVGIGPFHTCRVLTSSQDRTAKLWDVNTKSLLTTFLFPCPIIALAMDLSERVFFAASQEGDLHRVNLIRKKPDLFPARHRLEAVGGGGITGQVIRLSEEGPETSRLIRVGQNITCLAFSLSGTNLLVGLESGLVHIYDILSHQLLRTITTHKGQPISFLAAILKPPDLMGYITVSDQQGVRENFPLRAVVPFQRVRDPKMRAAHEVQVLLPPKTFEDPNSKEAVSKAILEEQASFLKTTDGPSSVDTTGQLQSLATQSRVDELESEIAALKLQLNRAKGINDSLWQTIVEKVIESDPTKTGSLPTAGGDRPMQNGETSRKRPRAS